MDAPARAVSGLTSSAQALFVAAATQALPHGVVLSVVPSDGDLEQAVGDVRFFAADLLVDAGFSREDPVDEHGEFAVRGGILDLFPAGEAQPVRLEFIGDTIESMRRYDPATQRSVAAIDQLLVVPLTDVLAADLKIRTTPDLAADLKVRTTTD